ncbi:putative carbonic anhydrase-like protein [Trypanosoma theileri]|uniref:carbonic anhydrase n=1 Tax=Trypanosoma theileri TaxID=67003 RepID=A0A1X0NYT7_9TRYP|nr:putative carbonic anhydrase-like protein [Trypanosoma theileri]ORC89761.1 putative carbonic anhydrase-like protein [Trypanosoma theileri]
MSLSSYHAFTSLILFLSLISLQLVYNPAVHPSILLPVVATNSYTTAGVPRSDVRDPEWSYANISAWPPLCREGVRQSPISFATRAAQQHTVWRRDLEPLQFSQGCTFAAEQTSLKIVNEVNTISAHFVDLDDPSGESPNPCTTRDPTDKKSPLYRFMALHFHSPVEHEFPRGKPDAELHLVFAHTSSTGKLARLVIAVQLVASNKVNTTSVRALRHILVEGSLPPKHALTTCTLTEDIAIDGFLPRRRNYLVYNGSLTTPPCEENVRFVVMTVPQIISKLALERLIQAFNRARPGEHMGNRRPVQPLNGRTIYRYVDLEYERKKSSKKDMKDYYNVDPLQKDVWGGDDEIPSNISKSSVPIPNTTTTTTPTTKTTKGGKKDSEDSDDSSMDDSQDKVNKWPRAFTRNEAILFTCAAILLLIVTFILYRRWSRAVTPGMSSEETQPLSRRSWDYGTAQL